MKKHKFWRWKTTFSMVSYKIVYKIACTLSKCVNKCFFWLQKNQYTGSHKEIWSRILTEFIFSETSCDHWCLNSHLFHTVRKLGLCFQKDFLKLYNSTCKALPARVSLNQGNFSWALGHLILLQIWLTIIKYKLDSINGNQCPKYQQVQIVDIILSLALQKPNEGFAFELSGSTFA